MINDGRWEESNYSEILSRMPKILARTRNTEFETIFYNLTFEPNVSHLFNSH